LFTGLANDHKALMKKIDLELLQIHAAAPRPQPDRGEDRDALLPPFAFINNVESDSPASQAVSGFC